MKKIISFVLAGLAAASFASASGLTQTQIDSILGLLASFGADSATIANVQAALTGQPATNTTTSTGSTTSTETTTTTKTYVYTRLLKIGKRGNDVKTLQECLNRLGNNTGVADGIFGRHTAAGVKSFQAAHGLVVDGIIGPQTGPKFEEACAITTGTTTTTTTTDNGVTGDKLVVSGVAADDMFVGPSQKVVFSEITVKAGDKDVEIKDMIVKASGAADSNVIEEAQILDSAKTIIDNDKTINSDDEFKMDIDRTVKKGTTETFYVAAVMEGDTDNTTPGVQGPIADNDGLDISLKLTDVVTDDATVEGLPIAGAAHTVKDNVSPDDVEDTLVTRKGSAKVGDKNVELARITVDNDNSNDVLVRSIKLERTSGDEDTLDDVEIKVGGQTYSADIDDEFYTFDFGTAVKVEANDDLIFSLYADIDKYDTDHVKFKVKDAVYETEDGTILSRDSASGGESDLTVSDSQVTLNDDDEVTDGNVSAGAKDVEMGAFTAEVKGEYVEGDLEVEITLGGTAPSDYDDVELKNIAIYTKDGDMLTDDKEDLTFTAAGAESVTFDNIKLEDEGDEVLYIIKADISKDAPAGATYQVSDVKYTNIETKSGESVGDKNTGSLATQTVESSDLEITISDTDSAKFNPDVDEQALADIKLDASNSGDDIRVNSIEIELDSTTDADETKITNCELYDGDDTVSDDTFDLEDAPMTFDLGGLVITKGEDKTITLKCDADDVADGKKVVLKVTKFDATGVDTAVELDEDTATPGSVATGTATATVVKPTVTFDKSDSTPDDATYKEGTSGVVLGVLEVKGVDGDSVIKKITAQLDKVATIDGKVEIWVNGHNKGEFDFTTDGTDTDSDALTIDVEDDETVNITFKGKLLDDASTATDVTMKVASVELENGTTVSTAVTFNKVSVVEGLPVVNEVSAETTTVNESLVTDQEIMVFKIKADNSEVKVAADSITFAITDAGSALINPEINVYRDSAYTDQVNATDGVVAAAGTTTLEEITIPKGKTYYFVVKSDVNLESGEFVIVNLEDDDASFTFTPNVAASEVMTGDIKATINTSL